jgi:hypothetical protein
MRKIENESGCTLIEEFNNCNSEYIISEKSYTSSDGEFREIENME